MQRKHSNNPKALTKSKELVVHNLLQSHGIAFDYQVHIPFASCGLGSETRCAYLDFVLPKPWGKVILEVDENQHAQYDASCDPRRDMDILASVALGSADKLCIVRYNPDAYQVGGVTQRTPKKQREAKLLQVLEDLEQEPEQGFLRLFLHYNRTHDSLLPSIAERWPREVQEISRCLA